MPEISKYREYLEWQIVSGAFFYPSATHEMAAILSASNFKIVFCAKVFQVIRDCSEKGIMTSDGYLKEIYLRFPKSDIRLISDLLETYNMGDMVREKCLILVELDMREKFCDALKQNELLAVAKSDFEKATMWKQCHDFLADPKMDVFDSIPKVEKYLSQYAAEELDTFRSMQAAIPKVIDRVRGMERSRRMINSLTSLANSPDFEPERRECVEVLKDLLVLCISRLPMPENLSETLNELKRNSWQLPASKSPASASF